MLRLACLLALVPAALSAGETLRIGVFGLFRPDTLVVAALSHGGVLRAAADEVDGSIEEWILEGGGSAEWRASGDSVIQEGPRGSVVSRSVRVTARDGGPGWFLLSVPGKIERRFHGTLEITSRAGRLAAVVGMDLETAVASAIAAESRPGAPGEALKAHAVAARSYYAAARSRHTAFDFCDTTHCQFLREPPDPASAFRVAVEQTRGLVLAFEGEPLAALYSASCGGRTRTLEETGLARSAAGEPPATIRGRYPYFPVECPPCRRNAKPWQRRLEGEDAEALRRHPNRETVRIEIARRRGWSALPGNHYTVQPQGTEIVVKGRGSGHGIGLCQEGATAMANEGASFHQILERYYPGTRQGRLVDPR